MSDQQRGSSEVTRFPSALRPAVFHPLPLGAIKPAGWLQAQLRMQADGLTGHLEDFWPDVGPRSGWLGGDGEDWERGPYYCDGLIPLAYLLDDGRLMAKAQRWIDWTLASQQPTGQFGPTTNDDWWPRMVMLKVLTQYHEATGDERVLQFMTRYFTYQRQEVVHRPLQDWGQARGADNVLSVYWLFQHTHDPDLLDLVDMLLRQTTDWGAYLSHLPARERVGVFSHLTHVVNVAMGLKAPAVRYRRDGRAEHLEAIHTAFDQLMRYHGQVQGMFSGDEWLAGVEPTQGVELCAVVELLFTLEQLIEMYGEGAFADRLELIAYNALATTITADMRAHQYDQQPNQVLCTVAARGWTSNDPTSNIFGLEPHFGCCTANMHQGWPKLARSLWMATQDGGLAAIAYAPCTVVAYLADGTQVHLEEETDYPFGETIRLRIHLESSPISFPLLLRIPDWCQDADLRVNGEAQVIEQLSLGFVRLEQRWCDGDRVELVLPMRVRALARHGGALSVARGPLVYALKVGEVWSRLPNSPAFGDWEVRPSTPWNYALAADPDRAPECYRTEHDMLSAQPFSGDEAAVRILTTGYRVPGWGLVANSAGAVPRDLSGIGPVAETLTLIPYGCARLRIAEFPCVDRHEP